MPVRGRKDASLQSILEKMRRYCAYQERCTYDVRSKLTGLGIAASMQEEVISRLTTEDFLHEERFARVFARGKFRINGWGRRRIFNELIRRNIDEKTIQAGLEEIEAEEYREKLQSLLLKKRAMIRLFDPPQQRDKLIRYGLAKGYEPELIYELLSELLP